MLDIESIILSAYRTAEQQRQYAEEHETTSKEREMRKLGQVIGEQVLRERQLNSTWESLSLEEKEKIIASLY